MSSERATLSACVIVLNEEERLPGCLDSVAFADEIVVVDSGSHDRTREIAAARGAVVVEHPWQGFAKQRNVAIDHARGEWILEVDADERVSPPLQREIRAFLEDPVDGIDLAALPLRDRFLGGWLGPSVKYPRYRYRLFRRGRYRHDESRTVHEGLTPRDRVWPFAGDLVHELAGDWREALTDAWRYARLEAAQLAHRPTARSVLVGTVARPTLKFGYRLIVEGGWRDGWRGVARIMLDCGSDALVWLRRLVTEPVNAPAPGLHPPPSSHFSAEPPPTGPVRLVALAAGASQTAAARAWLLEAAAAGADVALLTDAAPEPDRRLNVRRLTAVRPLAVARALDAERQLRAYDALVLAGTGRPRLLRFLAPSLRGRLGRPLTLDMDPRIAVDLAAAETRPEP